MNALVLFAAGNIVLVVLFWILLILCVIGTFVPDTINPWLGRGRWVIALILIAILGLAVFGNPTS